MGGADAAKFQTYKAELIQVKIHQVIGILQRKKQGQLNCLKNTIILIKRLRETF